MASLPTVSPAQAKHLVDEGAILVDIREADEYAREKIPGAHNVPLSRLESADFATGAGKTVVFHCRSGNRTGVASPRLSARVGPSCRAYIVEGGIDAWKSAGLPVVTDRSQPLELMRQVQIAAGAFAFGGTLLGVLISPWFLVVPGFVGAGLVTAGVTGYCGMAKLLAAMPWNRVASHSPAAGLVERG